MKRALFGHPPPLSPLNAPHPLNAPTRSPPPSDLLYTHIYMKHTTRKNHSNLAVTMLQFLLVLKLFHWNTDSYAKHVSSDQLYTSLSTHIDSFVEILIRNDKRPTSFKVPAFSVSIPNFNYSLIAFRRIMLQVHAPELTNIRDDIIDDIDQFTYRLTLH